MPLGGAAFSTSWCSGTGKRQALHVLLRVTHRQLAEARVSARRCPV